MHIYNQPTSDLKQNLVVKVASSRLTMKHYWEVTYPNNTQWLDVLNVVRDTRLSGMQNVDDS